MPSILKRTKRFVYLQITKGLPARVIGSMLPSKIPTSVGLVEVPPNCLASSKACLLLGFYEYAECYLIRKYLPSDSDCIELGASTGFVSRVIAGKLNAGRSLAMVEAAPQNIPVLQRNTDGSRFEHLKTSIVNKAIHYGSNTVSFEFSDSNLGGRIPDREEAAADVTVEAMPLGEVLGASDYSLVMDIEGAEYGIMRNESLEHCRCIIVELHGEQERKNEFIKWAESLGMRMVEKKHRTWCFMR